MRLRRANGILEQPWKAGLGRLEGIYMPWPGKRFKSKLRNSIHWKQSMQLSTASTSHASIGVLAQPWALHSLHSHRAPLLSLLLKLQTRCWVLPR